MKTARYQQLADVLATAISNGQLAPGTKLPTHRAFADKFNVAIATATRAYQELERRGMIVGEAGRGTFVRDLGLPPTLGLQQTANDGLLDLVFNMPCDPGDADVLRAGLRRLASTGDLNAILQYQPHAGRSHERRIIAESLTPRLGAVDPQTLLITSGSQHGLAVTALGLLQHGDSVATDALTYPGFKSVAAMQGLQLIPVDGCAGVMDPRNLDIQCNQRKIRAVYLMPTVHNPLGSVMDTETRLHLIEIARKHDLLIIEDAAYAFLEPFPPPPFVSLAPERTIHVAGVSKSLSTGLRLGFVIPPQAHVDKLLEAIRATTWNTPAMISGLVTSWIEDGTLTRSEQNRRQDGAESQRLCREVLGDLPILSHRNASFAWLPLENRVRAEPIVTRLKERGILVSGADPFATTIGVPQALRLAFGGIPKNELTGVFHTVRDCVMSGA